MADSTKATVMSGKRPLHVSASLVRERLTSGWALFQTYANICDRAHEEGSEHSKDQ